MYEFEGFGLRMQQLRKQKSMTQEDLAGRVGVTGQAVSKWENGQAYPDITLIPTLATILDTEIEHLFGKKAAPVKAILGFPETHAGMPMVHSTQYVACYSSKEVSAIDSTGVKFTDGSTAELSNRMAVNMGQGDIQFLGESDASEAWHNIDPSVTTKEAEFGYTQNLNLTVYSYDCRIIPSQDGKTRVKANGDAYFIKTLQINSSGDSLTIDQEQKDDNRNKGSDNTVVIEMPCEKGNEVDIKINGSGAITSEMPFFHTGRVCINGSGAIDVKEFETCSVSINGSGAIDGIIADELKLTINGSGAIDWKQANNAKVTINGSGAIDLDAVASLHMRVNGSGGIEVKEMTGGGDITTKIAGSGDIKIHKGSCEKLDVDINGAGEINATGLTAREASIVLHHDGTVNLGRVLERSTEQIKKKGRIKIHNRGHEYL
ncbi:MAG: DUF2807 domain-containing protein [Defluviitaleaceae bacterium]|nr:DUF2807 domain-containing protein [Defluviitaleaceae bacterium]